MTKKEQITVQLNFGECKFYSNKKNIMMFYEIILYNIK